MKRSQLLDAISEVVDLIHQDQVLIIGSQAILGTWGEEELPGRVTLSVEVDVAPLRDTDDERVATLIDVYLGEGSDFHRDRGFYVQGVGPRTAVLPLGWHERLTPLVVPGRPTVAGLCLERHDLCAAKLMRLEPKDCDFVAALAATGMIDLGVVEQRIEAIDETQMERPAVKAAALGWLRSLSK